MDFLMRYACRRPLWGKVMASNAPLLIQRRTVVSSTRKRRATSRTVNNSSISSTMAVSPTPFISTMLLLRRAIYTFISKTITTIKVGASHTQSIPNGSGVPPPGQPQASPPRDGFPGQPQGIPNGSGAPARATARAHPATHRRPCPYHTPAGAPLPEP